MEKIIIPSIIARSQDELNKRIKKVENLSPWLQLDIMDGSFVPNHSLDFNFALPKISCKFEAHLMIQNPDSWITQNMKKVNTIIIHYESCKNPQRIIQFVKENDRRIGIAINPQTPLENITKYINDIDLVLIMTVHPGFYGSKFMANALQKVIALRKLKPHLDIEVDGGITYLTIERALESGANRFVCGSYLMNSDNIQQDFFILKSKLF